MYHFTKLQSISKKGTLLFFVKKYSSIKYFTIGFLLSLLSFTSQKTAAQTVGDYRSIITGTFVAWNNAATWERYNGTAWVAATVSPDFNDGVITVRSPTSVRITASVTIDQTIVESGGQISPITGGITLTINNGAGTDLELNGFAASAWGNNCLLTLNTGALIDGPTSNIQYRGLTLINNGTINTELNPRPDVTNTTISGVGTIRTLVTSNNNGCIISGNQTITNLLNFNFGNVISIGNLVLATTATIQNNAVPDYYVIGNLQLNYAAGTSTKTYRIGDATGYKPVTLTLFNTSGAGGININSTNTDHPNIGTSTILPNKSVNRFWSFTNSGLTFTNVQASFSWIAADVDAGSNTAVFKVGKFDAGVWTYPNVTSNFATGITINGFNSFSDFQVGEQACIVNIPDANFKTALLANASINTNSDGEIQCTEAAAYNGAISVNSSGIASLTGIEAFTLLEELNCTNNALTSINVSANSNLRTLNCSDNNINNLVLTGSATLTTIGVGNNALTGTLNLSSYTGLIALNCANNQLTGLTLPTANTFLYLECQNNQISFLNTSANPNLLWIYCHLNNITTLDLSANTSVTRFQCNSNALTSLNIQNGNNNNFTTFVATNNPSLSCIKVDNVAFMNANWSAAKDATATYSLTCPLSGAAAALNFDGLNDRVALPNAGTDVTNKSFSVEMWLKRNSTNTYDVAFSQGVAAGNNQLLHIGFSNTDKFIFNFWGGANDFEISITNDNNWHHWACTFDNVTKERKVYRDGILIGQAIIPSTFTGNGSATRIGANAYTGDEFDGNIDEVRVWNVVRTSAQILANRNCEIQAQSGLLAAYHFNQGIAGGVNLTETSLTDASGNNNNGTLNNFVLIGSTSNWIAPGGVVTGTICCNVTLTTSAADTLIVCTENGQTTGSVTLLATGGTAPYIYGGSATTNIAAGVYNYTVTDALGCTAAATLKVILTNCIIPYYAPPTNDTTANLIGAELTQLFNFPNSLVDTTATNNIFLIRDSSNEVLIEVVATTANYQALKTLLQTPAYGMNSFVNNGAGSLIITGFFPIANLPLLNALPQFIRYVRPYFTPITSGFTGLTTTQGDKAMRSDRAKQAWKISGSGIKIGVMSDSYNTKFGNPAGLDVINGDLPGAGNPIHTIPVKVVEEYPYGRATDEGRAMLQIVHDVAPDAALYFRSGFKSADDFADGIKALRDSGCNVIVDDITYITEPFFNDGVIAKAVDNVTASGVSYFTSAGNFGTKSYEGVFAPITAPAGYEGMAHEFGEIGRAHV